MSLFSSFIIQSSQLYSSLRFLQPAMFTAGRRDRNHFWVLQPTNILEYRNRMVCTL
uniref:Uncharacterized protein n=1 Tax=Arundo donax TaxID=35708 RepID=A0A0A9EH39_ARUDO